MKPHKKALCTRRLYTFEDVFLLGSKSKYAKEQPIGKLRRFAKRVWKEYGKNKPFPKITAGAGFKFHGRYLSYCFFDDSRIILCRNQREKVTLLHELTHALGCELHDAKFARLYIELLSRYLGINKEMLTFAAQFHGVRV